MVSADLYVLTEQERMPSRLTQQKLLLLNKKTVIKCAWHDKMCFVLSKDGCFLVEPEAVVPCWKRKGAFLLNQMRWFLVVCSYWARTNNRMLNKTKVLLLINEMWRLAGYDGIYCCWTRKTVLLANKRKCVHVRHQSASTWSTKTSFWLINKQIYCPALRVPNSITCLWPRTKSWVLNRFSSDAWSWERSRGETMRRRNHK